MMPQAIGYGAVAEKEQGDTRPGKIPAASASARHGGMAVHIGSNHGDTDHGDNAHASGPLATSPLAST